MSDRIVGVAGDAGGAAALAPVLVELRKRFDGDVAAWAYGPATEMFRRAGLTPCVLQRPVERSFVERELSRDCRLLFLGTSVNDDEFEKRFLEASIALGVPSVAVLDFWSNYAVRFLHRGTKSLLLPTVVTAIDPDCRDGLAAAGVPPERIRITGHPALERLGSLRNVPADALAHVRSRFLHDPSSRLVVFVSQPFGQYRKDLGYENADAFPDEMSVERQLEECLGRLAVQRGGDFVVVVIPHPREANGRWTDAASDHVRRVVLRDMDRHLVALSSDLVVGMSSMLLIESSLLGCICVSVQPGRRENDDLVSNRRGWTAPVYDLSEMTPTIEALLFDEDRRRRVRLSGDDSLVAAGATERVIAIAKDIIG